MQITLMHSPCKSKHIHTLLVLVITPTVCTQHYIQNTGQGALSSAEDRERCAA